jgi:hypothetical protein
MAIDATPTNMQLEFASFQNDAELEEKFCDLSLTDFYSKFFLPNTQKHPEIIKHTEYHQHLAVPVAVISCSA